MAKTNQLYNRVNVFLSNLALLNVKVHNLHWNVEGREFKLIHELTERIYKMLQQQFDEVAEVLKMQGQMPLGSIAEYMKMRQSKKFRPVTILSAKSLSFLMKTVKTSLIWQKTSATRRTMKITTS